MVKPALKRTLQWIFGLLFKSLLRYQFVGEIEQQFVVSLAKHDAKVVKKLRIAIALYKKVLNFIYF